ncbi:MAG: FtsX-like permease family protein, partial [Longimicrobiales bacterium]
KMLLLAGIMVLAVVCVNVANLFLVRDQRRRRDLALRSALGANRKRLAAPVVFESLIIAFAGTALGSALVKAGERALGSFASSNLSNLADFTLDQRVAWFVAGLALLCCLMVGGLPALRSTRTDLRSVLAELSRGVSAGPGARRSRAVPIVLQVALTTVLLVCTLLLGRSVLALLHTPTGFDTQDVITLELEAPAWRYPKPDDARRFHEEVVAALTAVPGVSSVGLVSDLPFTGWNTFVDVRTSTAETRHQTEYQVVSADYFRAIGIAHRQGRMFQNSDDAKARPVALVNEQLARTLAPSSNVLGQRLRLGDSDTLVVEVVGVVGDILDDNFRATTESRLYLPPQQRPRRWLSAVVQTRADARLLLTAVRTRLQQLDAEVPVWNLRTLQSMVSESVKRERAAFLLLAIFTGLTLALALVGIYGVIAYTVSDRRREIGIRAALGADPARLAGAVLREAILTVVLGIMIGGCLAFFATRALQALLFGVGRFDPVSLAAAVTLLMGISLCAAWLPARRAARVPPWETLRTE